MTLDIQSLRKMRTNDFSKIQSQFEKEANPGSGYQDDRIWKLEGDKAGNGTAVIRFLPRHPDDELPWVKMFSHSFQGPTGKWYIENSLTTIGQDDPISEENSRLWATGLESNQNIARDRKRKLSYYFNILVVSDPKNPQNEGKVFIYRCGKKIFDKIMDKANPTYEDESPVNVFDLWEGANLKLRMRKKDGYVNYDESLFMEPSPVADTDEEILEIVNKQYRLGEFLEQKNFKTYDELKKKFVSVMASDTFKPQTAEELINEKDEPAVAEAPKAKEKSAPKQKEAKPAWEDDDEDEDLKSFFSKIAEDD